MKVAFASSDLKTVNQHFGSCESLVIYGVEPGRHELLQVARFTVVEGHDQNKLQGRSVTLSDGQTGTAHGVGEDGALLVQTAQGMQAITSAEISVRPGLAAPLSRVPLGATTRGGDAGR